MGKIIVGLLLILIVLSICLYAGCMVGFAQRLDNPIMVRLKSPQVPGAEILLCEHFFLDRDMEIFATMPSKDGPTYITDRGSYKADSLVVEWTNDGQVAVFMFSPIEYDTNNQPKWNGHDTLAGA